MLRSRFASLLRLDLRQPAGSPGAFTFYEKVFQFPGWSAALTLITVTGLVKLLRYTIPVPGGVLLLASTFHVAAMVLILMDGDLRVFLRQASKGNVKDGLLRDRYDTVKHKIS